jgi:hypothetical protein
VFQSCSSPIADIASPDALTIRGELARIVNQLVRGFDQERVNHVLT